ncbi:DUF4214 domain-containing protein [Roseomonas gilardii subsp. gilardii]|uniref:DUF4214 domain-containing protein n=1 Tax=Roseomonas gilardii TaxID=257708 RepID=UPI001FF9AF7F|nr:DUF4214 domain-containing protein [Roseomonas gilardii]UPG74119.1 DUF4214 domain-containing protein [Roseomonas gilardii subsp. gilardii]
MVGPINDDIANAVVIGSLPFLATGSNIGATQESGEPNTAWIWGDTNHSVWFVYRPTVTRDVAFNTNGSDFDTTLTVWSSTGGHDFGSMTLVTQNDDSPYGLPSEVTFTATQGLTYYIEIDGYNSYTGNYTLVSGSLAPNQAPTVSSVQLDTTDATLHLGQEVALTVALSADVVVTGTPTLSLNTGATATYDPTASDSTHLVFRFTVGAGEQTGHLDVVGIDLHGGSILSESEVATDLSGLVLNQETAPGVDGIPPVATLTQMDTGDGTADSLRYEVHFSEAVTGVDASDFHLVSNGLPEAAIRSVTPVDGSTYVVSVDAPLGIGSLSLELRAEGSGITDAAGNALANDASGASYELSHTGSTYLAILYEGYLGRAADADGITFWTQGMANGLSRVETARALLSSDEATAHQAGQTDAAFIEGLYGSMLGRTAADTEIAFWLDVLQHGAGRADVLNNFAGAAETLDHWQALSRTDADTQAEQASLIRALYGTALGRDPGASEIKFYQSEMEQGGSNLARAFANSDEFASLHANQSNGEFVEALYQGGLGRQAEAAGLAFWSQLLDSGSMDRAQVTQSIAESPEAHQHWALI